jgi:hypothetical protein
MLEAIRPDLHRHDAIPNCEGRTHGVIGVRIQCEHRSGSFPLHRLGKPVRNLSRREYRRMDMFRLDFSRGTVEKIDPSVPPRGWQAPIANPRRDPAPHRGDAAAPDPASSAEQDRE